MAFTMQIKELRELLKPIVRGEFVFSLGVIHGPRQPKNTNSFLEPFFDECRIGAIGILTYHSLRCAACMLRMYPICSHHDILGGCKLHGGKSPGAIHPCIKCAITAIQNKKVKYSTYYLPHRRPNDNTSRTDVSSSLLWPAPLHRQGDPQEVE
ncbi:hypothetical protein PIIN_10894 [Serendipita indica DSM 11827]|uniref:Uncharacterized protein n=1 Tax=Serendipita indica (strain DSM 11827) TaxID=1109443 RepID=G4U016_SERID|nr:hypothetical protein PIIN_10894 [Serendipita indica DSM 11827]